MNNGNKKIYQFGSFELNSAEHTLSQDGEVVSLTPKVFDTLLILIENSGHLVEKDELLEKVWADTIVEEANLAKNVSILRKVLSQNGLKNPIIETVPKRGYRFVAPVKKVEDSGTEKREFEKQKADKRTLFGGVALASILLVAIVGVAYWYFTGDDKQIESVAVLPFENGSDDERTTVANAWSMAKAWLHRELAQ